MIQLALVSLHVSQAPQGVTLSSGREQTGQPSREDLCPGTCRSLPCSFCCTPCEQQGQ